MSKIRTLQGNNMTMVDQEMTLLITLLILITSIFTLKQGNL